MKTKIALLLLTALTLSSCESVERLGGLQVAKVFKVMTPK